MQTFTEYMSLRDQHAQSVNLREESLFESPSLFKEMAILNPNALSKTQNALQFIHNNKIEGVLIGGMAVSHFTVDRTLTPDVDFLVSNMSHLRQILDVERINYQPLASSGNFGGIHVPTIDADFLDVNEGNVPFNKYIIQTATTARIGGVAFPVINPIVLTIMKFTLGRQKDTEDAFKLLPTLPKPALKTHLTNTQKWLGGEIDAKTIWSYAKALSV
jgi:hypothetical protein